MQRIIEQMLTLTRGQERRYPVVMETVCLNDIFDGVSAVLDGPAAKRNITLHFEAEENLELTADQSLITQLLLNLTENAIKYGRDGGDVFCRARREGDQIRLTVADNGVGISAENLPHIFERFFRADTARDRTGTGLGLSIAQWIVRLHDGEIRAESAPGEGTTFTITLPINR